MKLLIVICVVVLLLQFGVVGLGIGTGDERRPDPDDIEDGKWDPKKKAPNTGNFDTLLDPFRIRLKLPWEQKSFAAGSVEYVVFTRGHEDRRVAKFKLTGGTGVMIRYDCLLRKNGDRCPQITCLCPKNKTINLTDFSSCGRSGPNGNSCPADGDVGSFVVYSETGKLQFSGLGNMGGTVIQP